MLKLFRNPISPRRYFFVAMISALLLLGIISGVGIWSLFYDETFGYQVLYQHQLRKIQGLSKTDTVLLGDSSLGNAVNAELFSRLTDTRSVNLSLTGSYGYAGCYNLLKRLENQPVKNVVVICALDAMSRDISYTGYLMTLTSTQDALELPIAERTELVAAFYDQILSFRQFKTAIRNMLGYGKQKFMIESDYIRQEAVRDPSTYPPLLAEDIIPRKVRFLLSLRDYCAARNINLVYVHGPIYEGVASASTNYITEVDRLLNDTRIKLLPELTLISREENGDSRDHVAPPFKDKFTRHYADLLRPHLHPSTD